MKHRAHNLFVPKRLWDRQVRGLREAASLPTCRGGEPASDLNEDEEEEEEEERRRGGRGREVKEQSGEGG